MITEQDNTQRIRELNDAFRRGQAHGRIVITQGVRAHGEAFTTRALALVQQFDAFTPDNDPHGEHDFGSLTHEGERIFWKIDYYDAACRYGSEDPADTAQTTRVLTIMLADEY